jgi:hypothetical protein
MDALSLLYINLFPHDPLNLSLVKRYLLPINAYAFGSVLSSTMLDLLGKSLPTRQMRTSLIVCKKAREGLSF